MIFDEKPDPGKLAQVDTDVDGWTCNVSIDGVNTAYFTLAGGVIVKRAASPGLIAAVRAELEAALAEDERFDAK